ncbi:LysR family transcriptional regulator [Pseudomonas aeruginosa]|uniref:LysR family transcriptional regulator n=1 Tax=Pseudomonas aeruginosa TaxID=287 RepID=UPI000F8882DF|nr:LysR family transcriptional regulator [Pseudomonas aeruginosa]RUH94022.1 LysR family transcriptional regulator [Pseudomonas aeruginosa]
MDLNEILVFVKVVEMGNFSAAARLLGLPNSTVSMRVARLEKRLGVSLLQRTTRRLRLTDAGEAFYEHAAMGLSCMLNAENAVMESAGEPMGRLRVSAPADLGDKILASLIHQMRQRCPNVSVEMVLVNRYVDLVAEGIDVAIRMGKLKDSTLIAKHVGTACWVPLASPSYLSKLPILKTPQALSNHICLQFTPMGKKEWLLSNEYGSVSVALSAKIMIDDLGVIREMALAGEGIALLPWNLCRRDCEMGRLVRILPGWHAMADPIHVVYLRQRFTPPKLRVFIDLVAEEFKNWLGDVC